MSGPKIPWRAGRIDGFAKDATPDGRLPDATQGADHVRNVRDFLTSSEVNVTLIGNADLLPHGVSAHG